MKFFLLKNADNSYLNTDYHSRRRHGAWRPREQARLYKSLRGLHQAAGFASPAVKAYLGLKWVQPVGAWTEQDRIDHRNFWTAFYKISCDKYFELIAEDGYIVETVSL